MNLIDVLTQAGFTGDKLKTAWAIAMRESGGDPKAHNTNAGTGDNSYGLFQINMLGKLGTERDAKFRKYVDGYTGPDSLLDPMVNARAMKYLSNNGTNWKPWDIDANGYAGGRQGAAGYQKWLKQYPGDKGGGPEMATGTPSATHYGALPKDARQAATWAQGAAKQQQNAYSGLCDHYVAAAYGLPNSGYQTANAHWASLRGEQHTDNKPPVGALVFFETGKPAGHVALVVGYDKKGNPLISTTHANNGTPTTMTLAQVGMRYRGWTPPIFQNKSTPTLGTNGVATASEARGTVSDQSGIDVGTVDQIANRPGQAGAAFVPDALSSTELARLSGYADKLINAVPELRQIFDQAAAEDWDENKRMLAIQSSKWFKEHNQYARATIMAASLEDADWTTRLQDATALVDATAAAEGASLTPKQRDAITNRMMMEGWDKRTGGIAMLKKFIAEKDTIKIDDNGWMTGDSGDAQERLEKVADANGVKLSKDYFVGAAKSIATGMSTVEDWERDVRSQAASTWPPYADRIMGGMNVRDLASNYINEMGRTLEIDPNAVSLDDPTLRKAMTKVDDKGNLSPMGIYDFNNELRQRPEFMKTRKAHEQVATLANDIFKKMGFN